MRSAMLAAVLILAPLALAGDQPDPLPDSRAQAARLRYEKALIDAKTLYHASVSKAEADYIVELEGAIKRATQAERFDAAKVLMGEKERVTTTPAVGMYGDWRIAKGEGAGATITIRRDGTIEKSVVGPINGTWKANPSGGIDVSWAGGEHVWNIAIDASGRSAIFFNPRANTGGTLTRS